MRDRLGWLQWSEELEPCEVNDTVLVFPPVNNYRRFLIHKLVDEQFPTLTTFSIGGGDARRPVICFKTDYIQPQITKVKAAEDNPTKRSPKLSETQSPSPSEPKRERRSYAMPSISIYRPPAARRLDEQNSASQEREQIGEFNGKSDCKCSPEIDKTGSSGVSMFKSAISSIRTQEETSRCKAAAPAAGKDEASPAVTRSRPRRPDMKMYVPKARRLASEQQKTQAAVAAAPKVPTVDAEVTTTVEPKRVPRVRGVSECVECAKEVPVKVERNEYDHGERTGGGSAANVKPVVSPTSLWIEAQNKVEEEEVVVVVVEEEEEGEKEAPVNESSQPAAPTEPTSSTACREDPVKCSTEKISDGKQEKGGDSVQLNPDECDWEAMFDDSGECLDPSLLEQLSTAVGAVTIEKPKANYDTFKTKSLDMVSNEFPHVIEIYNFPPEFRLQDLMTVFSPFKNAGFEIKWVDDTHALGIFGNSQIVSEVLALHHPFVRTRMLKDGTMLSKAKARRSAEQLLPYKPRPDTCPALARRLVRSALGVRMPSSREEREAEKKILSQARERKRLEAKQREEAWEGTFSAPN